MEKSGKGRLALLDTLRGLTLISMILYHACWDAVYMLGADWPWYGSRGGYIWQQSICWTFILLSGFCVPLSKRLLRRGLVVFGAGALVMLVTNIVLPEDRVIFGVLTLIGSCMLLMVPLRKWLDPASAQEKSGTGAARSNRLAVACLIIFAALFVLFKDVNAGVIGTGMPVPDRRRITRGSGVSGSSTVFVEITAREGDTAATSASLVASLSPWFAIFSTSA